MDESVEIPFRLLSEEALKGLIEEFVSREGTDYGQGAIIRSRKRPLQSEDSSRQEGPSSCMTRPREGCNIALKEISRIQLAPAFFRSFFRNPSIFIKKIPGISSDMKHVHSQE